MEYETLRRIFNEVTMKQPPASPDSEEEAAYRASIEAELAALPEGAYLDFPAELEA